MHCLPLLGLLDLLHAVMSGGKVQVKFKSITNYTVEIRIVQPLQKPLQEQREALQMSEVLIQPKSHLGNSIHKIHHTFCGK